MRKINRVWLVNWHYYRGINEIFSFKDTNLITGKNQSGKSTILDAILFALTTEERFFNQAAENGKERKKKVERRSVKAYVRGRTGSKGEEYLYGNNVPVIAYVCVELYDDRLGEYFIIGVKVDSPNLESDIKKKWFFGERCRLEDYLCIVGNRPATDEELTCKGEKVKFYTQMRDVKDRITRILGGLPKSFFKILPKAVTFTGIGSIKDYVFEYILPEENIDLSKLRENIESIEHIKETINTVKDYISQLEEIQKEYESVLHIDEEINTYKVLLKIAKKEVNAQKISEYERIIKDREQLIYQKDEQAKGLELEHERLTERLTSLMSALDGDIKVHINQIEGEIREYGSERKHLAKELKELHFQISNLGNALNYIGGGAKTLYSEIPLLEDSSVEIEKKNELVSRADELINSKQESYQNAIDNLRLKLLGVEKTIEALSPEVAELKKNRITYDRNIVEFKQKIEEEFKSRGIDSEVRILADLLEINDAEWQNAVEGYLNSQKFHIIVEPKYYRIAKEVYFNNQERLHTTGLVDTTHLDFSRETNPESLASVIDTNNKYARAYINYLLNRVIRCYDYDRIEENDISIMANGMKYQGKVIQNIDPRKYKTPYIGHNALAMQLKIKEKELVLKIEERRELNDSIADYKKILNAIRGVSINELQMNITAPAREAELRKKIKEKEKELQDIKNDSNYIKLNIEMNEVKNQLSKVMSQRDEVSTKKAKLEMEIANAEGQLRITENENAEIDDEVKVLREQDEIAYNTAVNNLDDYKRDKSIEDILVNHTRRNAGLGTMRENKIKDLENLQRAYKNGDFGYGEDKMPKFTEEYNFLMKNYIPKREDEFEEAKENCIRDFKETFITKLHESINRAKRIFNELNASLENNYFGEDHYRFSRTWAKDKERFRKMIESELNIGEGYNIFSVQLENDFKEEMEELFAIINTDGDNRDRIISEYTDYRNYLTYDIVTIAKDGSEKSYEQNQGTDSGGEAQTPYYIAMAASLMQVYEEESALRLLMIDEALSNMDENRIDSMIEYLKKDCNFQLIFVVPDIRSQEIAENVEHVIEVSSNKAKHISTAREYTAEEYLDEFDDAESNDEDNTNDE